MIAQIVSKLSYTSTTTSATHVGEEVLTLVVDYMVIYEWEVRIRQERRDQ